MKPKKQAQRPQSGHKATKPKGNKPAPVGSPPTAAQPGAGGEPIVKPREPLTVQYWYPFLPPDAPLENHMKVMGALMDARWELRRRELELLSSTAHRIKRLYDAHGDDRPRLKREIIRELKSGLNFLEIGVADTFDLRKVFRDFPELESVRELAWVKREITRRGERADAEAEMHHAITALHRAAPTDPTAALVFVHELLFGIHLLHDLCFRVPDSMKWFARRLAEWPGVVYHNGSPSEATTKAGAAVELGADTPHPRMKNAQGWCEARNWAQAIVETLDLNREPMRTFRDSESLRTQLEKQCAVTFLPVPDWARQCAELADFGSDKSTLKAWKKTGVAMLKEQYPDFHKHREWVGFNRRGHYRTEREKANSIVDAIKSAMDTLAGARPGKRAA